MARWWAEIVKLWRREDGATMVEYTLMMVLIAAACFAAVANFGSALAGLFQRAVNGFPH